MSNISPSDETGSYTLGEGIALALKAEDSGNWKSVAEWMVRNPSHAGEVAEFLAAQRGLESVVAGPRRDAADYIQTTTGGYELCEVIGRGAMGVVYKAIDSQLKREVAVKRVRPGSELSTTERTRFRYEAEIVASLRHPNIIPIHVLGEDRNGPYLVMPLVLGGSLETWLKSLGPERCLPGKMAATIVREIALGVHHAHDRGLIHRDLKPANILLDDNRKPLVADFGLARSADATATGIAGTPAYMAPEQVRGEKYLTKAVDVHALGAILFELLTGHPPFGLDNPASVMRRIAEENAPSAQTLKPDVPGDLESICSRCLKKSPEERYPSALALAETLQRFLDGKPIDDSRVWIWSTVLDALNRKKEVTGWTTSGVLFWGAASTFLAMSVMQAAVLLEWPLWISQASIAYYLFAWLGIMWVFLVVQRDRMSTVERGSTAIYFGAKFSCMAILPVQLWLHDGNPVFALPSFLVLVGLAIFFHGILYRGRYYLDGVAFFIVAACLPLIPWKYWPGIYGLLLGGAQLLTGYHIYSETRRAQAMHRSETTQSIS